MILFQLLIAAACGWLHREQADLITFLHEESRVLKARLSGHRLRFDDNERRRLAELGHRLGRRLLAEVATVVTPDTILRWHRELVARKWTYGGRSSEPCWPPGSHSRTRTDPGLRSRSEVERGGGAVALHGGRSRHPNAAECAELQRACGRFVRSVKEECLNRVVPLGEWHLRRTLREFVTHYHRERNHQGLANELIERPAAQRPTGAVRRRQRVGGILSDYYRSAA